MADLEWRPPTTTDIPAWVRLMAAVEAEDHEGEVLVEDDLADEFESTTTNAATDAWFGFEPDGELAAFGWAMPRPNARELHRVQCWGAVRPDCRRQGIGTHVLAWLERRSRELHAELYPVLEGVAEVGCAEHNVGLRVLLERAGYQPLRYWYEMRRDLSRPIAAVEPPLGIALRPYEPSIDDALRQAHNEAFADHWASSAIDAETWHLWMVGRMFRPDLSVVALDGADVAGYVLTQHYPQDAEAKGYTEAYVGQVGTRRPWRGRGLATSMLAAAMRAQADAGLAYTTLTVDAANPTGALGLYERLGFEVTKRTTSYATSV